MENWFFLVNFPKCFLTLYLRIFFSKKCILKYEKEAKIFHFAITISLFHEIPFICFNLFFNSLGFLDFSHLACYLHTKRDT